MNTKIQPLKTIRTALTPLREDDFADILSMYKEPDTFKYVKPFQNKNEEYFIEFLNKKLLQNESLDGIGYWVARDINSDNFIGIVNLNPLSNVVLIQLGCHLKQCYQKQGFATELTSKVLEYGVTIIGLSYIYGIIEEYNFISKRLMEKLNFKFEKSEIFFDTKIYIYKHTVEYPLQLSNSYKNQENASNRN